MSAADEAPSEAQLWLGLGLCIALVVVLIGAFSCLSTWISTRSTDRVAHEKTVQNCLWQHRAPAECGVLQ